MLEAVAKPQIRFAGQTPVDENAPSHRRRDEPVKETGNALLSLLFLFVGTRPTTRSRGRNHHGLLVWTKVFYGRCLKISRRAISAGKII